VHKNTTDSNLISLTREQFASPLCATPTGECRGLDDVLDFKRGLMKGVISSASSHKEKETTEMPSSTLSNT